MPAKKISEIHKGLDRTVRAEMRRTGTPGVAVGILNKGRRYVKGYGVTNVDHPLDVDADTLFQIGSTTKTYTATAIMRLVDQGKLDLHTPVRRYLRDLKLKNKEAERRATLLHLLTHTGGWLGDYFGDGGRGDDALENIVRSMAKIKQLTPLGEIWSYNNSGFYIAGRVIEKATKRPFETAINELLLHPLGMENCFWFADDVLTRRFAAGHITHGKKSRVAEPWALNRSVAPAGGIISDVSDQLTWAAFHLGDGKAPNGKRLLRKRTLSQMQKPQAPAGSIADSVGISWMLRDVGGLRLVAHGGTTNGQLSAFVMVPEKSFAVTVLTNSTRGGELHRTVTTWALENYLGLEAEPKPKLRVPSDELERFAGRYRLEASGAIFQVFARNGGLVVKLPSPPQDPSGKKQPDPPLIPLHFVEPDKVTASKGYYKGSGGEFLRSSSGRITWFRFGARIHRRVGDIDEKAAT